MDTQPTFGIKCPQCGLFHPPLKEGEKCPIAKDKDDKGNEIDFNPFIIQIKNIILAKISKDEIKNTKKLLADVVINMTNFVEKYKEEKE